MFLIFVAIEADGAARNNQRSRKNDRWNLHTTPDVEQTLESGECTGWSDARLCLSTSVRFWH